ncbi:hypothetical protein QDA11_gp42 [Microbacterium phage Jayden]|uniref:Uncharacterized protein n=1 Tax=Microbacterium phage Jayden TaxID=2656550 RepID=A0A649VTK4_9CAUD|nr:hypothetical protein QDA11_gp42 [Microbacterium phage Jayden]QGJ95262.1 hypothetical protein PBI_JAYDEN_42 [Microbacterium phage Jayden]
MDENPWWPVCVGCGAHSINPNDPARYDVLSESEEPRGPFCAACFAETVTGQVEPPSPAEPSPERMSS